MNIGIFLGYVQERTIGGGYTFSFSFIEQLKQVSTKHNFFVFYYNNGANSSNYNNGANFSDAEHVKFIPISLLPKYKKKFPFYRVLFKQKSLEKYFLENNIDVVYAISPVSFKTDLPSFVTIWDFGHKDVPYFPEVFEKKTYDSREKQYSILINRASRVIVSNNSAKQKALQYYRVQEDKIIINPLPTPSYIVKTAADESVLQQFQLEKNAFIFYPAQFWAHKNHIRILKAVKILKERGISLKVAFSGSDRGNMEYIKNQVAQLGLQDLVVFLGFITNEQIIALYKNTLALVYASLMGPDNLPPLEAMALKCPAILSAIEGHKEFLKDCCMFFNPLDENDLASQLETLLKNGYPQELIDKGYNLAISNSMERYLCTVLEEFDKFMKILECYKTV